MHHMKELTGLHRTHIAIDPPDFSYLDSMLECISMAMTIDLRDIALKQSDWRS
mgnify:CR=1 FL=1